MDLDEAAGGGTVDDEDLDEDRGLFTEDILNQEDDGVDHRQSDDEQRSSEAEGKPPSANQGNANLTVSSSINTIDSRLILC